MRNKTRKNKNKKNEKKGKNNNNPFCKHAFPISTTHEMHAIGLGEKFHLGGCQTPEGIISILAVVATPVLKVAARHV